MKDRVNWSVIEGMKLGKKERMDHERVLIFSVEKAYR